MGPRQIDFGEDLVRNMRVYGMPERRFTLVDFAHRTKTRSPPCR